jgi:hypothetical protein
MNRRFALGSLFSLATRIFGKPKKQSPAKCEDDVDRTLDRTLDRTVYAIFGGDGRPVDAVEYGVSAMVRLEPLLKGRESQVAVVIFASFAEFLKERGEFVGIGVDKKG